MIRHNLWTPSNLLSMSRVVMLVPIVYFLLQQGETARWWAIFWMFLAMLTDNLDGRVARARNEVTEEGKALDPLADKICIGVVVVTLAWLGEIPLWFVGLIVGRDVLLIFAAFYIKWKFNLILMANKIGKVTATIIAATILVMALPISRLDSLTAGLTWSSVVAIIFSMISYLRKLIELEREI
jgi:CDP-diacylglycerol---glycerol-3-phosphate 3-phosphatidyltransferase